MKKKVPITVVILTLNEAVHIQTVLENVINWAAEVFVLDSYSTDNTCEVAELMGAKVFYKEFTNYGTQRNYAIKELPIETDWMLFLDADEYLTDALKIEIKDILFQPSKNNFNGFYLKRRFYFMGKWIRYGGYYPTWILRLFKKDKATCEREVNEHINVQGEIGKLKNDFVDDNKKDFTFWLDKHNKYASFEATQFEDVKQAKAKLWGAQSERKQWIRQKIWNKILPPIIRPFVYFIYRYFFRLGFLDGKIGFIYHFMHALVFQLIIDIKYLEQKRKKLLS